MMDMFLPIFIVLAIYMLLLFYYLALFLKYFSGIAFPRTAQIPFVFVFESLK